MGEPSGFEKLAAAYVDAISTRESAAKVLADARAQYEQAETAESRNRAALLEALDAGDLRDTVPAERSR